MKANTSVSVISELSIRRPKDEVTGLDRIRQRNQTAGSISFEWKSDYKLYNTMWRPLQGNYTRASSDLLFVVPGNRRICVRAHNLFSHQERCILVDVLAPITGLRLVAAFQEGRKLSILPSASILMFKNVFLKYLITSGSKPEFRFDFGDNTSLTVANAISGRNSLECTCVTALHVFNRCGNVTVKVTASNAVSQDSVTHSAKIHAPIDSLELDRNGKDCVYVAGNVSATLKVKIKEFQGCVVFFVWNFNDSSSTVRTKGEFSMLTSFDSHL